LVGPEVGDPMLADEVRILLLPGNVIESPSNWWPLVVGLSGLLALLVSVPV